MIAYAFAICIFAGLSEVNDKLTWFDDTDVIYTPMVPDQNTDRTNVEQLCVVLDHEADFQWKMTECDEQYPVICQYCK